MDAEGVSLSHPYDFFRIKNPSAIPGHCFVVMPFSPELRPVYETVESAIGDLMICTRADDLQLSDSILERILHGIGTAELIIVDVTGKNANVFYELGLAHTRTKNVLLITQNAKELPFDLRDQFCYQYRLRSALGRKKLAQAIRKAALRIRAKSVPSLIDGAPNRTTAIVSYMERLLSAPQGVEGLLIRAQARLSSLGNVGQNAADDQQPHHYAELLERERELLIRMLEQG